jgi:DNA-directed RNA polymerase subunit RPC12/RpoP
MSLSLEDVPLNNGQIACPQCGFPSLAWNFVCVKCGADLMPEPEEYADDDAMRHKQENAA